MTEFLPPEPEESLEQQADRTFDEQAKKDFLSSAKSPNHIKWREDADEEFDFVPGGSYDDSGQWRKADIAKLKDEGRPIVTLNRIEPMIEGIVGAEVNNRQEVSFQAREKADKYATMALNEVGKWARDNDVEEEESDAFKNTIVCGMGWTIHTMDYTEDLDGKYTVISTDPLGHYWDTDSRRPNLSDARWVGYVERMSRDKFRTLFPGQKGADNIFGQKVFSASDTNNEEAAKYPSDYDDPNLLGTEGGQIPQNLYVLEYQTYKMEPAYRILDPDTGELTKPLDKPEFERMKSTVEARGAVMARFGTPIDPPEDGTAQLVFRYLLQERRIYYRKFYSGNGPVDEQERNPWRNGFTMQCITGRRHRKRRTWYGIVRAMKDPQWLTNSFMSASIHHYNSNPKGGLMWETGAWENPEGMEAKLAHPAPSLEVNPGFLDKIIPIQPANSSPALDRLFQVVTDLTPMITGISLESLGLAGRDQPIGLEQTRKLATMSIVSPIFSSLRKYRKQAGRLLFDYLRDFVPLKTMERVVSEESRPHVKLIKDSDTLRFDIHVDDAPLSPSIKATVFSVMKDMMQFMPPEAARFYLPSFLEWSPLPQALVDKLLADIQKASQPNPMKLLETVLGLRKLEAEGRQVNADAELKEAKTVSEGEKIELKADENRIKELDSIMNLAITQIQAQASRDKESAE